MNSEMVECLEPSCVSAKIMFLLELYSLRTMLQEQKLELTSICRSNKPLKGMLISLVSKSSLSLTPLNFFHLGVLLPCAGKEL